jgi:hypothetical protein
VRDGVFCAVQPKARWQEPTGQISYLISWDSTVGVMNEPWAVNKEAEEPTLLGTITEQQRAKTITGWDSMCYSDLLSV